LSLGWVFERNASPDWDIKVFWFFFRKRTACLPNP
jgi:hypothetical protein